MRKSVIVFGILFGLMTGNVNANVNLIDKNPRLQPKSIQNVAPLSLAIVQNDYRTVQRFLELGCNIEVRDKTMGMTPLMYAARYNNVPLLKLLVAKGASVGEISKLKLTALQYAEYANAADAVEYLKSI
ncbi:MAG: ankyrin repeat domain-containing protein [Pricia sp.]